MLGPIARISTPARRGVLQSFVRNGSHGGVPGENLPFDIYNKKMLTFNLFWYVGTGLAAPFIVLWHQLAKKLGRNVMTTFVRNHSHGGVPGENLPFDITNRYKLTAFFILFAGSGLSAPYLITRHQLLKK